MFDAKEFVKSLALDAVTAQKVEALLADPKVVEKLGPRVLAQADYSKNMDALQTQKTALETKLAEANTFYADTATWKKGAEGKVIEAQKKAETLQNQISAIQTRMGTLRESYGIEEAEVSDLFKVTEGAAPVVPVAAVNADANYTKLREETGTALSNLQFLPATIHDIASEHSKLFPGTAFNAEALTAEAIKNKVSLKQQWETQHKVPEKREELKVADIRAQVTKEVEDRLRAERSAELNPGARPLNGVVSPVLAMQIDRPNHDAPKDPNRGIKGAINSFGTHGAATA